MKKVFTLLLGLAIMASCNNQTIERDKEAETRHPEKEYPDIDDKYGFAYQSEAYIIAYDDIANIEAGEISVTESTVSFPLEITFNYPTRFAIWSEGNDYSKYEELCLYNSDTEYNKEISGTIHDIGKYCSIADNIVSIDFIADNDYDKKHPAGSSLNDIVVFDFYSVYQFIQSGYSDEESLHKNKVISDITANDMRCLSLWSDDVRTTYFTLPLPDSKVETCSITMRVTTESGKNYDSKIYINI